MAKGVSDLSVSEIDIGNRKLPDSTDMETAIVGGGRHRYAALALLCWLHERRDHPDASLESWREKTPDQLMEFLGADGNGVDPAGPTEPTP